MRPSFYFGIYHWRRRFRRLAGALALVLAGAFAWRESRPGRLLGAGLAVAGLRRARPTLRRLFVPPPWRVERYKYRALAAELPLADADRHLDVGCGTGRSLVGLADAVPDGCATVGLDVFDDRVILGNGPGLAARNARTAGLDASLVASDAGRLPVADATQDVVTACRVLHDLPRAVADDALAEARRVLRPDGTLGVLELPVTHGDADADDPLAYWRERVEDAGFDVTTARRVWRSGSGGCYLVLVADPA